MKVLINGQEILLFRGAKIKHALLKKDPQLYKLVLQQQAEVRDQEGNHVDLQGAVAEGWHYEVVRKLE